jgi:hypothetical protein
VQLGGGATGSSVWWDRRCDRRGASVASDLRNHIAPFFAGKTLDRIRPEDIERYVAAKRKTLAVKTIRNHVNKMHSIFDLGLRKGWCQVNPVKQADRPTVKKTETRRQPRSTRTTSRATKRRTPWIGRSRDRAADPRRDDDT